MFVTALLPLTARAQSWYNATWNYRKKITINASEVGTGTHVNFPVLVSMTDVSLKANALSTGNDILFTSSNGTTKLDHEIESYNSLTGEIVAWVEVPSLSSAANTELYMYYGNAAAASQQAVTATWTSSFRSVYHLNSSFVDATANNYNGTNTGTISVAGKMANGRGFVASNGADYITIAGEQGTPTSFTLSAWVYVTTYDASGAEVISIGDNAALRMTSSGVSCFFYNGSSWVTTISSNVNYANAWHHVVYTATNGAQRIYVDGVQVGTSSTANTPNFTGLGANTFIGKHGNASTGMDFTGALDEVRVASAVRSAAWIQTEYNNQGTPSAFYTLGNCESVPPVVTSPVNYCQGATATQLSATGTNLAWGTGVSGVAGGTSTLSTATYVDYQWTNQKTNFTTTAANVTLSSVDFFIPAWNSINGFSLAIYNSTGTVIASSSPITQSAGSTITKVTVPFNFLITAAGNYSIGVGTGYGNVGGDAPSFPLTEATGTINITGKTGAYRCFNNFIFSRSGSSTAPTPSTATAGTTNYLVTQSPGGCVSTAATIAVVVTGTVGTPTAITVVSGTEPTCQLLNGTTTTTYGTTASNNTGFNWSLSNPAAGSISSAGVMTWANGFSGSVTVRATANGCNGPSAMVTRAVTITPTVGTPTAITVSAGTQPTCRLTNGTTTTTYATTATNSTSRTWSLSNAAAGVINSTSGVMTWANGFAGTVDIRVVGNGCNGPSAQVVRTVNVSPSVSTPVFTLGASSSRCQAAGTVSYAATAANSTAISYTLDATSLGGGNSISATTGDVTFASGWSGTSTITATAAGCNGPVAAAHTVTINAAPTVSGVSTPSCVGGSTGTITASASGGLAPYTFNLNGGAGQSSTLFTGRAAGSYTLNVVAANGCTDATTVIVSSYGTSPDNQAVEGNDTWVGHVYDGTSFSNYIGSYTAPETFNESFGGSASCFSVTSNSLPSSIYTETFSVKYRNLSSRRGLYIADLGSDDGSRLTVDGIPVYDSWSDHSFTSQPRVLLNLTGASSLLYEYYENGGGNQVVFQNLVSVVGNTLTANTSQSICLGSTGAPIGGDTIGTLPAGLTASGTGYQWSFSTTPAGARTAIAGATGATFTPSTALAPFNAAGTYYVYRNVALSSSNNVSPNPYVATNESIAATLVVTAPPAATISYSGTPFCSSAGTGAVTRTGTAGGTYSSTAGLTINSSTGAITPGTSSAGTYTVSYTVPASGGCPIYTATTTVTITTQPYANGYYPGSPYCSGAGIVYPTATIVHGASGTVSSTAGLAIDAFGGVNLGTSVPGSYVVTYTVPASGGCAVYTTTTNITISAQPAATISYPGNPLCSSSGVAAVSRTGTAGGVYSAPVGLSLNPSTGDVTPGSSTPGSYTVTYTMVNGACTTTATAPLTITAPPTASISYSGTPFCSTGGVGSVTLTGSASGTYSSTAGLSINAATGAITPASSTAGIYTVTYTIPASGGCAAVQATTTVTITEQPFTNAHYPGSPYCSGPGTVAPTATVVQGLTGSFSSTAGLVVDALGVVNLATSTPGTYTVTYTVPASGGCAVYSTGTSISISTHSSATIAYPGSPYCSSGGVGAVTHSGTTGGVYSAPAGLAIHAATGAITPGSSTPGTYTVVYTMVNGGCTDTANTSVTINAPASATISYATAPFCSSVAFGDVTLTGATGGTFSATAGLSIDPVTGRIIPSSSTPGTYTVTYTMTGGGCTSMATTSVTVSAVPAATISYATSPLCSSASTGAVTFSGTTGGVYSSTAGLSINAATGAVTPNTSTIGSYTVTYTIAANGGCAAFATTANVIIAAPGTWTGAISTAWHTAGNWYCGAIPTITTDVVIGSGLPRYPVVSSGTRPARNITIQSGASLTVTTILQIAGSVTNNGTFTASNGTILLSGSTPQSISAGQFATNRVLNLTLSNASGVTLNGPLGITGVLRVTAGSFSTGGNLTLISSATRTALIDGTGAGSVLGNVTMQRYLPSGFGYKYLSSPFQAASVSQLSNVIDLGASFPTFYRYNENQNYAGWLNYTDPSGIMNPMHGYAGNFGNLPATKTISLSGTVNNGTLPALTLYNNNQPYTQGFNLVGNPYPSPINWTAASGWTKTNIDNAIYYFNAGSTDQYGGTYSSYINGISSDGIAAATIPSMQGFFVHVSNGSFPVTGTLGFSNAVRVNNLVPVFHKQTNGPDVPLFRISAGYEAYPELSDPAVVYFEPAATEGFEQEFDALKMINTEQHVPSIYCVSGSDRLSINAIPQPGTTTTIPLAIQTDLEGAVIFTARDIEHMPAGLRVYFADRESGLIQDLGQKPSYKQVLAKGVHNNRFFLLFSSEDRVRMPGNEELDAYMIGTTLNVHMTEGSGTLAVTNALGQIVRQETLSGQGRKEIVLREAPGIYIVTLVTEGGRKAKKVFVGGR